MLHEFSNPFHFSLGLEFYLKKASKTAKSAIPGTNC
jgi:hypothetical protein